MPRSELHRRLKAVDPNLTIIPGGVHKRSGRANDNWDRAAGVICSSCGREAFRIRQGLCMACWEDMKDKEVEVRDTTGITNWLSMDIIKQITHQARKDQQ